MSILNVLWLSLLVIASLVQGRGNAWPIVQPFAVRFPVDLTSTRVAIDVPIMNSTGREVYHFACRGGSDEYLGSLPEVWVAPLMCTLAEGQRATEESLLSEDDVAAWHSRGQFRREELTGDCAKYPEFGLHRSFRLRGFQLILDVEDVVMDHDGVAKSFVLAISLERDESAQAAQAERPGFLDPRGTDRGCRVVVRGREPRMCRGLNGSWEPCKE